MESGIIVWNHGQLESGYEYVYCNHEVQLSDIWE